MDLPLSVQQIWVYIGWLSDVRGVQADTVRNYLQGLRMAHIARSLPFNALYNPLISQIITGLKNYQSLSDDPSTRPMRRAMTLPLLMILGHRIATSPIPSFKKQLIWALSLLALFGAFRLGELLSKYARSFDPKFTLLGSNVKFSSIPVPRGSSDLVRIHIKSPKISRPGKGEDVEVFSLKSEYCPVKSLSRYSALKESMGLSDPSKPFFRQQSGANYTKSMFNIDLKKLLHADVAYDEGESITTHSFRSAISSHMSQWGFLEDEVKGWGRWTSDSYKRYCKLPLLTRRRLAQQLQEKFEEKLQEIITK